MSGKKTIHTSKLTPIIFLSPIFLAIATFILLQQNSLLFYLSIVTTAFMFFQLMKQTIRFLTYRVLITDISVVIMSGIIKKNKLEFMLSHISGVSYKQGYFGRLVGFGSISLVVTGVTQASITHISSPKTFCNKLLYIIDSSLIHHQQSGFLSSQFREQAS